MAYERIQHSGAALITTLASDITSGATSLILAAATGWPDGSVGPFYLTIDPGLATEEKIKATSRTTNTLNTLTRGVDGPAAAAHSAGATIIHSFTALEADEANVAVTKTIGLVTTKGDLLVATGSQALARQAAGANDTVLVYDSSQTAGVKGSKIVAANITAGTITGAEIANDTITSTNIVDGTIVVADLADNAVETAKIKDANVTAAKLADGVVPGHDFHTGQPSGDADVASATFADWSSYAPNSTVPSWATTAKIRTEISGTSLTAPSHSHFRTQIGSDLGNDHVVITLGDNSNEPVVFTELITLTGTGVKNIKIQAKRSTGTGVYRSSTFDWISFDIQYYP